jgi:hypothetical protein
MNNIPLQIFRSLIIGLLCFFVNPLLADLGQELRDIQQSADDRAPISRTDLADLNNTSYGREALGTNASGKNNSAFGAGALKHNTTGFKNTAIGHGALHYNTTGKHNVAIGNWTIGVNTTGHTNVGLGDRALSHNTTGNSNAAVGNYALGKNTTGQGNTAVGIAALYSSKTGGQNTALGYGAMYHNAGEHNAALGSQTLLHNRRGNYNTVLGAEAGYSNVDGSSNVFIGFRAGYKEKGSNKLIISNNGEKKPLIDGDFHKKTLKFDANLYAIKFSTNSDIRLKTDIQSVENALDQLSKLEGRRYRNTQTELASVEIGLIAQEVEKVFPEVVSETDSGYKAIAYHGLIAILIEALKEQQERIKQQELASLRLINSQQQKITRLEDKYNGLMESVLVQFDNVQSRLIQLESTSWALE